MHRTASDHDTAGDNDPVTLLSRNLLYHRTLLFSVMIVGNSGAAPDVMFHYDATHSGNYTPVSRHPRPGRNKALELCDRGQLW